MLTMTQELPTPQDPHLETARDPNATPFDLSSAAVRWPREVLANPALALDLVASSTPVASLLHESALAALVRYPEAPEVLIESALERLNDRHYGQPLARMLLANPNLTEEQARAAAETLKDSPDQNGTLANHRHLPGERDERGTRELLHEHLATGGVLSGRSDLRHFLGTGLLNLELAPAFFAATRNDHHAQPELALAMAPVTPADELDKLLDPSATPAIRTGIAENPNTSAETLERLYQAKNTRLRARVAAHPTLTPAVREQVLTENDEAILCGLARNPSLTVDEQLTLARREESTIRQFLCLNPNLTTPAELELARNADSEIARQLLRRDDLRPESVEILKNNPDHLVRLAAPAYKTGNQDAPAGNAQPQDPLLALREALATRPLEDHRLVTATCTNTPGWLLDFLAGSANPVVRLAVAAHHHTPDRTRSLLAIDPDVRVARAAQEPPCL